MISSTSTSLSCNGNCWPTVCPCSPAPCPTSHARPNAASASLFPQRFLARSVRRISAQYQLCAQKRDARHRRRPYLGFRTIHRTGTSGPAGCRSLWIRRHSDRMRRQPHNCRRHRLPLHSTPTAYSPPSYIAAKNSSMRTMVRYSTITAGLKTTAIPP